MIIITTVLRNMCSVPAACIVNTLCTIGTLSFDFAFINMYDEIMVLIEMLCLFL